MTDSNHPRPDGDDDLFDEGDDEPGKRLFERVIPEVIKRVVERAVETGVETLTEGPENIRKLAGDLKVPKEAAQYMYTQIDDTKKGVYRVVAKEIRDVLEHTNFADEIAEVLTKLQFEITTQIRFVPHTGQDGDDTGEDAEKTEKKDEKSAPRKKTSVIPRPKVVSKVAVKALEVLERRGKSDS